MGQMFPPLWLVRKGLKKPPISPHPHIYILYFKIFLNLARLTKKVGVGWGDSGVKHPGSKSQ